MVTNRDKKVLDFAFEKAKEINEFLKANGYTTEELDSVKILVFLNGDKPSYIESETVSYWRPSGNSRRNTLKLSIDGDAPAYREYKWEDKS